MVIKLAPVMLPTALTMPEVFKFPPCELPVTTRLDNVPIEVSWLNNTLALSELPVSKLAAAVLVTPVNALPFPVKYAAFTLAAVLTLPDAVNVVVLSNPVL